MRPRLRSRGYLLAMNNKRPAGTPAEDDDLIREFVRCGNRKAFVLLIERHIGGMRRLLFTLFNGNRDDMEDAEQEILLSLFQSLSRFKGRSSFKTYLYRFCRNKAIDILRKNKRERKIIPLLASMEPAPSAHPEDQVVEKELKQEERDNGKSCVFGFMI